MRAEKLPFHWTGKPYSQKFLLDDASNLRAFGHLVFGSVGPKLR
jgi:hypothetical protein